MSYRRVLRTAKRHFFRRNESLTQDTRLSKVRAAAIAPRQSCNVRRYAFLVSILAVSVLATKAIPPISGWYGKGERAIAGAFEAAGRPRIAPRFKVHMVNSDVDQRLCSKVA
jgi:hypothetical protein